MTARTKIASALLTLTFVFSATAWPQEMQTAGNASYQKSSEHYFELTFRVLDIAPSGRVQDAKSYKEILASGPKSANRSSIRSNDRVQIRTGFKNPNGSPEIQFGQLGTQIDANNAAVVNDSLTLHIIADIRGVSSGASSNTYGPILYGHILRQTSWDSNVTVPIGKPTIIFSSDNSADKGRTELELTAREISNH